MKLASGLGTTLICLAGGASALASPPEAFLSAYSVTQDQLLAGRSDPDGAFSFASGTVLANGAVMFEGASLDVGGGRRIQASSLTVAADWLAIQDATLTRHAEGEAFSRIELGTMRIDGRDAHEVLTMSPRDFCVTASQGAPGRYVIDAAGLRIAAPSLGAGDGMSATEALSIDSLVAEFGRDGEACASLDFLRLQRLSSETPDGDALTVGEIMAGAKAGHGDAIRIDMQIADAAFLPSGGGDPTRAGAIELQAEMAREHLTSGLEVLSDPMRLLSAGDWELGMTIGGIAVPVGELMPGHVLEKLALAQDDRFDGKISLGASLRGGQLRYEHDLDLTGLAGSVASLAVDLGGSGAAAGLRDPMSLAASSSFLSGEFGYEDRGLAAIIEAATGRNLADLLDQAATGLPGPDRLKAPVIAWLGVALQGEGRVKAEPPQPVPLMQIAMMAAISPAGLAGLMALAAD